MEYWKAEAKSLGTACEWIQRNAVPKSLSLYHQLALGVEPTAHQFLVFIYLKLHFYKRFAREIHDVSN